MDREKMQSWCIVLAVIVAVLMLVIMVMKPYAEGKTERIIIEQPKETVERTFIYIDTSAENFKSKMEEIKEIEDYLIGNVD